MTAYRVSALVVLLSAALAKVAAHDGNHYIEDRDREIAELAQAAAKERCKEGFQGEIPDNGRERLETLVGEENFMLEALKASADSGDALKRLTAQTHAPWIALQSLPLILGIVIFLMYWCVCWSLCPWSKCWPCMQKEGQTTHCCKISLGVLFVLWAVQIAGSAVLTNMSYKQTAAGIDNSVCSAAKILDITLSGQTKNPTFRGMVSIVDDLWDIEEQLEDDSILMRDLASLLNASAEVADALQLSTGTFELLSTVVSLPQNLRPHRMNQSLMHETTLADSLSVPMKQAEQVLLAGRAAALASVRADVEARMSNRSRTSLGGTLRSSLAALVDFKVVVREIIGFALKPGRFQTIKEQIDTNLFYITHLFLPHSALILVMSIVVVVLVTRRKDCETQAAWISWCSWECGCVFVIPAFVVGGLMLSVTPPMAGMCLIMDDVDSQLVHEISHSFPLPLSEDQEIMMGDLADRCVAAKGDSSSLFDVAYGRSAVTNEKVYLGDAFVRDFHDPLVASFDELSQNQDAALSTDSTMTALRYAITSNPADAFLVPNRAEMLLDAELQKLNMDTDIAVGYTTSTRCSDFSGPGGKFTGMQGFVDQLLQFGTADKFLSTCLLNVTCNSSLETTELQACNAGNAFVRLKADIINDGDLFRCDVFESDNGSPCDPKDMVHRQGVWQNDCLLGAKAGSKTMQVKKVPCSLQEFTTYVQEFDSRIAAALQRLDDAKDQVATTIEQDLRDLLDRHLLTSIESIASESSCSYMPPLYRDMLDSFCHQSIFGLISIGYAYVLSGIMVGLSAFAMYTLWRSHFRGTQTNSIASNIP